MSDKGFRIEVPVNINGRAPKVAQQELPRKEELDYAPRIARLLALAHKWEGMVRRAETDYASIAQRYGLSRARVSQICSLVLLAAELQDAILFCRKSLQFTRCRQGARRVAHRDR